MLFDLALLVNLHGLATMLLVMVSLVALLDPAPLPERGDGVGLFGAATAIMVVAFAVLNFFDKFFMDDSSQLFRLLVGLVLGSRALLKRGRTADGSQGVL
jgi:hypothetical protein